MCNGNTRKAEVHGAITNLLCAQEIASINSAKPESLKFSDFAILKTYGLDRVSRMKMDDLKDAVTESELEKIRELFQNDDHDVIKVLRWIKRGLSVNYAIRKVEADQEISLDTMIRRSQSKVSLW